MATASHSSLGPLACPMADLFPDSKACRLHFVFGDQTITDAEDIFVSQLKREGKMDQLDDFSRSFTVAHITVDTVKRVILIQKKGPLSSPEVGERWVSFVREKINDVLGPVTSQVVNAGQRSMDIQESLLTRCLPSPGSTVSCLLSSDQQSLLLLSSDAREVRKAKEFIEAELQSKGPLSRASSATANTEVNASATWFDNQALDTQFVEVELQPEGPLTVASSATTHTEDDASPSWFDSQIPLMCAANADLTLTSASLMTDCEPDPNSDQTLNRETAVRGNQFREVETISDNDIDGLELQRYVQLEPVLAMYLQGVRGQHEVDLLENEHRCHISVRSPWQRVMGKAMLPGGHEIRVCEGNMAAMDCHVMLLPLSVGQDWSPLQKHILNRNFLASDMDVYTNEVGPHPLPRTLTLPCNTTTGAQRGGGGSSCLLHCIEIMAVPPRTSPTFREEVQEACKEVFEKMRTAGLTSVTIPVPLSTDGSIVQCLGALVPAVEESLRQRTEACKVFLVSEELDAGGWRQVNFFLLGSLPSEIEFDIFTPDSNQELALLTSTEPHVLITGDDQDITACLNQIQIVAVPEDFRRHAELLVKFLQDGPRQCGNKKMKRKDAVVQLCAATPSTTTTTETEQKQTSPVQLIEQKQTSVQLIDAVKDHTSKFYPLSSPDSEEYTSGAFEQQDDIRQNFVSLAVCPPKPSKTKAKSGVLERRIDIRQNFLSLAVCPPKPPKTNGTSGVLEQGGDIRRNPTPLVASPPEPSASDGAKLEFVTRSGIKVSVYKADITRLQVDVVVNPSDGQMTPAGGVAHAIAAAAGTAMTDEIQDYVRRQGSLRMTRVVGTTSGRLRCQKVLHTLGPLWNNYQDKTLCRRDLADTVFNCLRMAADEGFTSVALPSISAGLFGVPHQVCAEQYLSAVQTFEEQQQGASSSSSLTHIHFVDIADDLVSTIQQVFTAKWNQRMPLLSGATPSVKDSQTSTMKPKPLPRAKKLAVVSARPRLADNPTASCTPIVAPAPPRTNDARRDFVTQGGTTVSVYVADISQLAVDAVVSATNAQLYQGKGAALAITTAAGPALKTEVEAYAKTHCPVKVGHVVMTSTPGRLSCQRVLLAVGPRWADYRDKAQCQRLLTTTVFKCLEEAEGGQLASVALPLISSGVFGVPAETCSESYVSGIEQFEQDRGCARHFLKHVHFVDIKEDKVRYLRGVFSQHWGTGSQGTPLCPCLADGQGIGHQRPRCGGGASGGQGVVVTPALQPPDGTMTWQISSSDVSGYEGQGSLNIVYTFPAGTQTAGHPHPGRPYSSTRRNAYLPNTPEGRQVLMLLKIAFDRQLVFTMGISQTTGQEGIVWNVGNKTKRTGGQQNYGYPDPHYLRQVEERLARLGVTEKDVTDAYRDFIDRFDN